MMISQCVSGKPETKDKIKSYAIQMDQAGNTQGTNFKKVIDLITGSSDNYDNYV